MGKLSSGCGIFVCNGIYEVNVGIVFFECDLCSVDGLQLAEFFVDCFGGSLLDVLFACFFCTGFLWVNSFNY